MVTIKVCVLNPKPEPRSTNVSEHWQNHKWPEVIMGDFNPFTKLAGQSRQII